MNLSIMKMENVIFIGLSFFILLTGNNCIKETPDTPRTEISSNQTIQGCDNAQYSDWETSKYVLPYSVGQTYSISLSHCSGSYHSAGMPDQFAIDFNMSIGTAITACREGRVVHVEESGFDGGFPNNLVVIQHGDGTYMQYMHLTQDGAEVQVGENVTKGQLIGYSGSTGLAGFPHLHLVATKGSSWEYPYISFPTTFSNTSENEFSLQQGESYTALSY